MINSPNTSLKIKLRLWLPSRNEYAKMDAIFDTGASKTIIDAKLVPLLEINPEPPDGVSTITASGLVSLDTGHLPKIMLGTQEITHVPVSISSLPEELEVYCVLGMNVLREFLITVDSLNRVIILKKQPLPAKYQKDKYSISMLIEEVD